jgi:septum formation protein
MAMSKDVLYLASKSKPRQRLLTFAQISYKTIGHGSDERIENPDAPFAEQVLSIARSKIRTAQLPKKDLVPTEYIFVLTADSLVRNPRTGIVLSKPLTRQGAIAMLTDERSGPVEVVTGCCLEKFHFRDGMWQQGELAHWTNTTAAEFYVDEDSIDRYLATFPIALQCSGAGVVEEHGLSYLKSINGSYSSVIGLPLYELRQELKKLGFKF